LAGRLIEYYEQPRLGVVEAAKFVETIQREFALLEARAGERGGELEILRSLLYLAYPLRSGDARVVNSTDRSCRKYPEQQLEFLYLGCWAARRMKRYAESILFADRGIAVDQEDPRFYHGRSLSVYCWIDSAMEGCSKVMKDAIDDAVHAVRLLERDYASDSEMLSAGYNNIAYFCLQSDPAVQNSMRTAVEYFEKLLKLLPRSQWTPKYPEYFHTESVLLYHQYLALKRSGATEGTARPMLTRARAQLRKAIKLDNCREYSEFDKTLELALQGH
jgi:hypothetical protein